MLQIGLIEDGVLNSCLNVKEGDDAGSRGADIGQLPVRQS
jgi:hypothetical protein